MAAGAGGGNRAPHGKVETAEIVVPVIERASQRELTTLFERGEKS